MDKSFRYLVPVSDSLGSRNAKEYAFDFFANDKAEGTLLHVLEKSETETSAASIFENIKNPGLMVRTQAKEMLCKGEVVEEILSAASRFDPDLIIISSMGQNKENRFFSSQRAIEVITRSYYPVMMIPPDISYSPVNTVVFATDMKTNNVSMVQQILHLFRKFRCTIHLLVWHTGKPDWHYREEVSNMVTSLRNYWDYDKIFVSLLEAENPLIQLEMFLKEQKADVLAFDKNNSRFQEIFFQNPENQMPCCTDLPILALPG